MHVKVWLEFLVHRSMEYLLSIEGGGGAGSWLPMQSSKAALYVVHNVVYE